jgi:hypothetical protein
MHATIEDFPAKFNIPPVRISRPGPDMDAPARVPRRALTQRLPHGTVNGKATHFREDPMTLRRFVRSVLFALLFVGAVQASDPGPGGDPWAPLNFLVGTWGGQGSGKPGEAISGATTFAFDLGGKILVRRNRAEYPGKEGGKNVVHEDLMIFYPQEGDPKFRAVYFDNEGHVIRYGVTMPAGKSSAVFETDPAEKGPRFRLIYDLLPDGALSTEFLIAPPGGDFKSYVKGVVRKSKP